MEDFSWETLQFTQFQKSERDFISLGCTIPPYTTFWVGQIEMQRNLAKSVCGLCCVHLIAVFSQKKVEE